MSDREPQPLDSTDYEARVQAMADAIHEDCVLEWQAIRAVDPGRMVTQHMADAHFGRAHDFVRRLAGLRGGEVFGPVREAEAAAPDTAILGKALLTYRSLVTPESRSFDDTVRVTAEAIVAEYDRLSRGAD